MQPRLRSSKSGGSVHGHFGCGLHFGEVLYGNIGSPSRLDFTVLGPAVNLTARIEGLSGQLERTVVVSEVFANLTSHPVEKMGSFDLKGIDGMQPVYSPKSLVTLRESGGRE